MQDRIKLDAESANKLVANALSTYIETNETQVKSYIEENRINYVIEDLVFEDGITKKRYCFIKEREYFSILAYALNLKKYDVTSINSRIRNNEIAYYVTYNLLAVRR